MRLRIGTSTNPRAKDAVATAVRSALVACRSPAVAVVFTTFEYDHAEVLEAASGEIGRVPWAGVVTPAILAGRRVIPRGVAVGVVDCDKMHAYVGASGPECTDPREAGRRVARAALVDAPLLPVDRSRAMLLFSDTERWDAAEVVHGALSVAGAGVAWGGGGTGNGPSGERAVRYAHGHSLREPVVALTLDCHARVGVGIQHGWQPTGPPAMVTRVDGCRLVRLEHRPAFEIYRTAAEERGECLDTARFVHFAMTHPLGIPQADGEYLIRDPLSVDDDGALRFLASVPDSALVRVMEGSPATLVGAARIAASMAREDAGGDIGGALVFDCISRSLMLGSRLGEELSACQDALGEEVPMLGCLTFGEVGAFGARMPQFHNKTMVVLALPA